MPLNMVKKFGHGLTLLVPLTKSYSHYDYHVDLDFDLDDYWFESVFGKPYSEIADNTVIYMEKTQSYYSSNP